MKILILANNSSGLYKFRNELIQRLIKEKHQLFLACPDSTYSDVFEKWGCKNILTPINRRGKNIFQDFSLMFLYNKILKEIRPDVVFTYTIKPNIYGGLSCTRRKIPFIVNITGLGTALENESFLQKVLIKLYRAAMRGAKTIFFQNESNQEFFERNKIGVGKHKRIPGSGVNLQMYTYLEYPKDDTIHFSYVSRLMKEKGIDLYLEAAKAIKSKYSNVVFHVCGSYEESYKDIVAKLEAENIIKYHGYVKDIKSMYRNLHCIVHPTYYPEGMSNTLLEAAASGRPIITTNRPGCGEIIDDGINGYVFRQKDSNDLIDKIERFINLSYEEKRAMGQAGRQKVEKEFDRQIVVEKYIEELRELK